jgi:hypothetical protein
MHAQRQRDRKMERQRDREMKRQRDIEMERQSVQRDRDVEKQRDKQMMIQIECSFHYIFRVEKNDLFNILFLLQISPPFIGCSYPN